MCVFCWHRLTVLLTFNHYGASSEESTSTEDRQSSVHYDGTSVGYGGRAVGGMHAPESAKRLITRVKKSFDVPDRRRFDDHLMNDWELAGNKNSWVCPSDRHLALRAQLKSGWSVHTSRQQNKKKAIGANGVGSEQPTGISEAERAQIAAVLAKAEQTKTLEENRIGKLVERLSNMRRQAVGNGVTQCMLCCAEFGLLGSMRSYGAMCYDCRKYVCQKNCGVDCYDQKMHETIFLCKLCSESREIWKKTGAWFYHDLPKHTLPVDVRGGRYDQRHSNASSRAGGAGVGGGPSWARGDDRFSSNEDVDQWTDRRSMGERQSSRDGDSGGRSYVSPSQSSFGGGDGRRRQPLIPPDPPHYGSPSFVPASYHDRNDSYRRVLPKVPQVEHSRPSARVQPRWAMEQVGSSMSFEETSSDEDSRRNSAVPLGGGAEDVGVPSSAVGAGGGGSTKRWSSSNSRRPTGGSRGGGDSASKTAGGAGQAATATTTRAGVQRISVSRRKHAGRPRESDDDSETAPAESQSPTPPSSPRHSLTTPSSSHAGDLAGGGGGGGLTTGADRRHGSGRSRGGGDNVSADSRSVDSGVVQSDHSQSTVRPSSALLSSGATILDIGAPTPALAPTASEDSALPPSTSRDGLQLTTRKASSSAKPKHSVTDDASAHHHTHHAHSGLTFRRSDGAPTHAGQAGTTASGGGHSVRKKPSAKLSHSVSTAATTTELPSSPEEDNTSLGTVEFTLNFDPEDQTLSVNMLRAKGLRAMDSNGLSDPFVKLNLLPGGTKSTKLRTKTVPKSLNPDWNEILTYYGITEDDKNKKTLRIQMMDEDRIGSDFLGETRIPLKKIVAGKERRFHVYLEKQMPLDIKTSQPDLNEPGKILVTLHYDVGKSALMLGVIRAAELVGMDGSGYSDPYCRIALLPLTSKAHKTKTKVKRKTCNPEWNEEFALRIPVADLKAKTLELSVFDRDVGRHDDYIGGLVLGASCKGEPGRQWNRCLQNPGEKFKSWHRLTPEHTGAG